MGFSSLHTPNPGGYRHGTFAFKAGFALPAAALDSGHSGDGWVDVRVPFSAFSVDTSEYTGRCDTTDPGGGTHRCCSAQHPEVCPQEEHLASLRSLQLCGPRAWRASSRSRCAPSPRGRRGEASILASVCQCVI